MAELLKKQKNDFRCSDCKILDSFMLTTIRRVEGCENMISKLIDAVNRNTIVSEKLLDEVVALKIAIKKTGVAGAIEIIESEKIN